MLPPELEICIEGYNTDQVDFYVNQLIEKINSTTGLYEKSLSEIKRLEEENNNLRKEFLSLVSQINNFSEIKKKIDYIYGSVRDMKSSDEGCVASDEFDYELESEPEEEIAEAAQEDSAAEQASMAADVVNLQQELSLLKEFLKK